MTPTTIPWGLAACLGTDTEVWFAEGNSALANADRAEAKAVCARCPIRTDCLVTAIAEERGLSESSRYGIRGGKSPKQRYEMERRYVERHPPPKQQRAA
ncbi:WhiB family transcriptional regulator [Streptomyces rubiginosohelvolus]|uniref:Transcriptional regulator WhiB n=1 Tax=Streptomyces rubiginosohelvolus TaxID=67362 RepID=A0ABQ3BN56_9ACTN|nr:WhiB family transcriptional regulator [Streptomyces pluricolorescens]GGZ51481.1 transcriptional regulator WhiB [Streptomyces pluricolorescens]